MDTAWAPSLLRADIPNIEKILRLERTETTIGTVSIIFCWGFILSQQKWEQLIQQLVRGGILQSPNVIKALRHVPRGPFLPEQVRNNAAVDCPLSIGSGQTASAPLS
jgi:hypothetical protein